MVTQLNITGIEEEKKEKEFSLGDGNKMTNSGTWTKVKVVLKECLID